MEFIEAIAPIIQKYAPQYGIRVCSPIIAQAVLESKSGASYKAVYGHNYFGLKYRKDRCPVSCGKFLDKSAEQNADGSYTNITDYWFAFQSMEEGVIGYFQFINTPTYEGLKGLTDARTYLETIKEAGYATSIKYVENVMDVIRKYNLEKYDKEENAKMRINVHAGHNPAGKVACGAVGLINESTENRRVKDEVISQLRQLGHTVYDCTVDNGTGQQDVLKKIVAKCNAHAVDLDVSIHFNSGAKDEKGNGKTTGVEVYSYDASGKAREAARCICDSVSKLGFRNRGVKISKTLYVLKNTKAPAILIECCFVDDRDDVQLYNYRIMASAIVYGITGQRMQDPAETNRAEAGEETTTGDKNALYRVQVGAYSVKTNAEAMRQKLQNAGFDALIVQA